MTTLASQPGLGLDTESTASQADALAPACQMCSKSISSAKGHVTVKCALCDVTCHLGCMINSYVSIYGGALKTSLQWLADFLRHWNFQHVCGSCKQSGTSQRVIPKVAQQSEHSQTEATTGTSHLGNSSSGSSQTIATEVSYNLDFAALSSRVTDISQQLTALIAAVSPASTPGELSTAGIRALPTSSSASSAPATTYAGVAAKDLRHVVQSAVIETIAKQRTDERTMASVAVYGLPDNGRDRSDLKSLLSYIDCRVSVVNTTRIGRSSSQSSASAASTNARPRPLKVELATKADRECLLDAAKHLKYDDSTAKIFISPWLSKESFNEAKALRQQCRQLNDSCLKLNGRKRYVISNNKLMCRQPDGTLRRFKDATSSADSVAPLPTSGKAPPADSKVPAPRLNGTSSPQKQQPKNGQRGSHAAPSSNLQ